MVVTKDRCTKIGKGFIVNHVLRPHWKALTIAFVADHRRRRGLLEPWPIKIVLDYVIGSKQPPEWLAGFIASNFGRDKLAILNLAASRPWSWSPSWEPSPITSKSISPPKSVKR